uniref:Uncharacterized protein n=1 Tax=Romanomermis culicivorax TaxID=13658 RepID=A0A915JS99_ROMCU
MPDGKVALLYFEGEMFRFGDGTMTDDGKKAMYKSEKIKYSQLAKLRNVPRKNAGGVVLTNVVGQVTAVVAAIQAVTVHQTIKPVVGYKSVHKEENFLDSIFDKINFKAFDFGEILPILKQEIDDFKLRATFTRFPFVQ